MRGLVTTFAIAVAIANTTGCSLVLDWDLPPDAGLPVADCMEHEPANDTVATAPLIEVTYTGPLAICPGGDIDYFRFAVPMSGPPDNRVVTVAIRFLLDRNPMTQDLDLHLFTFDGSRLIATSAALLQTDEVIVCPSPTCAEQLVVGEYLMKVDAPSAYVYNSYLLNLTIAPP